MELVEKITGKSCEKQLEALDKSHRELQEVLEEPKTCYLPYLVDEEDFEDELKNSQIKIDERGLSFLKQYFITGLMGCLADDYKIAEEEFTEIKKELFQNHKYSSFSVSNNLAYAIYRNDELRHKREEIRNLYERTLEINPECYQSMNGIALLEIESEKYDQAFNRYEEALKIHPQDIAALINLGYIFIKKYKLTQNSEFLDKARDIYCGLPIDRDRDYYPILLCNLEIILRLKKQLQGPVTEEPKLLKL